MDPHPKADRFTLAVPGAVPRQAGAWEWACHLFAIAGPIGFIPWVPATFASLATAAVALWLRPGTPAVIFVAVLLTLVGAPAAGVSERVLGVTDPRNVVIDEVAGQLLTFVAVCPTRWTMAAAGFVLFRIFDVLKPPPVNLAERFPRGWGILADDLVAGLYAALVLWLIRGWL